MEQSKERLEVLERMRDYESNGIFDQDVEIDPPTFELLPNKVDYLHKKLKTKIMTFITLKIGAIFFRHQVKAGTLIVKDIIGQENLPDKKQGAIVTCNHFNIVDNYVALKAVSPCLKRNRIFKVIREGNYTNPPKGAGMIMRYGDTLPLSSNLRTMAKFMSAMDTLLKKGKKVLVYPEQAMWWNYRKPRPLKPGAFKFAIKSNVPVIPVFICMEDTDKLDKDGFPIQAHTAFVGKPIYPDENLSTSENVEMMSKKNFDFMKETYEKFYNKKLQYNIKKEA